MKRMSKSYNMNNKGSAIITALVVSAVLLVLCLSLLLVATSLFSSSVLRSSDFQDREYIFSVAEEVEKELTGVSVSYKDDAEVIDFFSDSNDDHKFWDYIRFNLWQGFVKNNAEGIYEQPTNQTGVWLYYDPNDPGDHGKIEKCSKYFTLNAGDNNAGKVIVQLYWELPEGFGELIEDGQNISKFKNDTILHAIYRLYGDGTEVISKVERIYKLSIDTVKPVIPEKHKVRIFLNSDNSYSEESLADIEFNVERGKSIPSEKLSEILSIIPEGYNVDGWYYTIDEINALKNGISITGVKLNEITVDSDINIYAFCNLKKFTVTFIIGSDGVSVTSETIDPQTVFYKSRAQKPSNPVAERHDFDGWYRNLSDESEWNFDSLISENITLYAKWIPKSYCYVTFHYNDGLANDVIDTVEVEKGNTIQKPEDPISRINKHGNNPKPIFFDWYTESDCNNKFNFSIPVNDSLDLFASWTSNAKAVFYVNNTDVNLVDVSVDIGHSPAKILPGQIPTFIDPDECFEFDGWYAERECNNSFNFNSAHPKNVVEIFANWKRVAYKVYFDLNGHNDGWDTENDDNLKKLVNGYAVKIGNTITNPTDPSINHYTFGGWYTDSTCTDDNKWDFDTVISDKPVKLFAKWITIEYTITYNNVNEADNSLNITKTFTIESDDIILCDASKAGYTFDGWYLSENPSETDDKIILIPKGTTGDVVLYAAWDKNVYNINYENLFNSSLPSDAAHTYTVEDDVILKEPERDGYDFEGWYLNSNYEGEPIEKIEKGTIGNISVYAKWSIITYNISYSYTDVFSSNPNPTSYTVEDTVTFTAPVDISNKYEFNKWVNANGEKVDGLVKGTTGDKVLYANYSKVRYDITYNKCEFATNLNPSQGKIGEALTLSQPIPEDESLVFLGWYKNGQGEPITVIPESNTDDIVLVADWDIKRFLVTFNENGHGNLSPDQKYVDIEYGNKVSAPSLSVEGYTLDGWYTDALCSVDKKWDFNNQIKNNIDLYAKWNINTYSVKFMDGNQLYTTKNIEYSNKISEITEPHKEGYNFAGWYTDIDCEDESTKWNFELDTVKEDIILYAKWSELFTVQFIFGEGDVPTSISNMPVNQYIAAGGRANKPDKTPIDNNGCFTFIGWYNGDSQWSFNQTINENIKLIARWKRTHCLVSFDTNGGNNIAPVKVEVGKKVSKPSNPKKDGYSFINWFTTNGSVYNFNSIVNNDISLHARWDELIYTVKFNQNTDGLLNLLEKIINTLFFLLDNRGYNMKTKPSDITGLKYLDLIPKPEADYTLVLNENIISGLFSRNVEVPDYYFTGWYKDKKCENIWNFNVDRVSGENVTITLYAGWVNKKTVNSYNIPPLNESQTTEFNKWYTRLTPNERNNFGDQTIAKKFWYMHVREDAPSSEPSIDRSVSLDTKPVTVQTSMAPNESEQWATDSVTPNDEDTEHENETEEVIDDSFYKVSDNMENLGNSGTNPYNFSINPREIWTWSKVG